MAQFLRDPRVLAADIIAIQELQKNPFQDSTYHPAKGIYELLQLVETEIGQRARVCIYISKKLVGQTYYAHSGDLQEVRIRTEVGEVRIFNIYNDQVIGDGLNLLKDLVEPAREQLGFSYIIVGDFNLYHPVQGGDDIVKDAKVEDVLILMDIANLGLQTELGMLIRINAVSQTTIDLVLVSRKLYERLIVYKVSEDIYTDLDYLLISTQVNLGTQSVEETRRRYQKIMDIDKFLEFVLANLLGNRGLLDSNIRLR